MGRDPAAEDPQRPAHVQAQSWRTETGRSFRGLWTARQPDRWRRPKAAADRSEPPRPWSRPGQLREEQDPRGSAPPAPLPEGLRQATGWEFHALQVAAAARRIPSVSAWCCCMPPTGGPQPRNGTGWLRQQWSPPLPAGSVRCADGPGSWSGGLERSPAPTLTPVCIDPDADAVRSS